MSPKVIQHHQFNSLNEHRSYFLTLIATMGARKKRITSAHFSLWHFPMEYDGFLSYIIVKYPFITHYNSCFWVHQSLLSFRAIFLGKLNDYSYSAGISFQSSSRALSINYEKTIIPGKNICCTILWSKNYHSLNLHSFCYFSLVFLSL